MTYSKHEKFIPERVDEQIDRLWKIDMVEVPERTTSQLVQRLQTYYLPKDEDKLALKRVQQRLEQYQALGLSDERRKQRVRFPEHTLDTELSQRIRPLHSRAQSGRKKVFLAVAAIVAMTFLCAIVLTTIGTSWIRQNQRAQTPLALSTVDSLLIQQLWQSDGTPANVRQLAQNNQFTQINLHLPTGNVAIQQAYADANNVVFAYTVDLNKEKSVLCSQPHMPSKVCLPVALTVTTSSGQMLTQIAMRMGPLVKNQRVAILAYYDASSIRGNVTQLHLTVSLAKGEHGELTVPFHADKTLIEVNQTATSHSEVLTLKRVIITPTEIRFDNQGLSSKRNAALFPKKMSIAGKSYDPYPASSDGWISLLLSDHFVSFYDFLQSPSGTWTVTEEAKVWTGASFEDYSWTFTFTAS